MSTCPGIMEVNVYGVQVPGCEGRCGMALLKLEVPLDEFDQDVLYAHLNKLPPYARPVFLRMANEIQITSTFKHRKADLVRDG